MEKIKSKAHYSGQEGYTLIQLAMAIMIIGIVLGGMVQAYAVYLRHEQIRTTDDNIRFVVNELQRFKQLTGRFPCPAPLSAPRTDATYGAETDCTNNTVVPGTLPAVGGTGENGVAIVLSSNASATRVRIGTVPFRALNIDEKTAFDGYGSRLVYALTESAADRDTYDSRAGGIGILSSDGVTSVIDPPDSALFALLSPGRDKAGAYNREGTLTLPCSVGNIDSENCDLATNARFSSSLERNGTGGTFDDRITYFSELADTMWARNETEKNNIGNTASSGNVGVGKNDPAAKLDIEDSSASGGPSGVLRSSDALQANNVCPEGALGSTSNCFAPENIAGDNTANPANNTPGPGMKCPTGEYMMGIQDGRAICGSVASRCSSANQTVIGFNADGTPNCGIIPCTARNISVCSTPHTLPASTANPSTTIVVSGGSSGTLTETWTCRSVSGAPTWQLDSSVGSCTCTPTTDTEGGIDCGYGFSGTFTRTTTTTCPDGNETVTDDFAAQCTCQNVPPYTETYDCPNENYSGNITYTWNWICPDAYWSDATVTDTCTCNVPAQTTRSTTQQDCPEGYTGDVTYNEIFNTGTCQWEDDGQTDTCTCNASETRTTQEDPSCEPWEYVDTQATYTEYRDGADCTWGTKTLTTPGTCAPRSYTWQIVSSPGGSPVNSQVGPMVGSSTGCNYTVYSAGATQNCSASAGSQFQIHRCQCKP